MLTTAMKQDYAFRQVLNTPKPADTRTRQTCGFFMPIDFLWPGSGQRYKTRKGKAVGTTGFVCSSTRSPSEQGRYLNKKTRRPIMAAQSQGATAPTIFQFQDSNPLRAETDEQGNPWFLTKDVCDILGYENHNKAVKDHCKQDGVTKRYPILDTLGRTQYPLFISEGNLYRLIIKSNKPEAEPFETWVCDIVLPAIRKTGRYVHPIATTPADEYLTAQDQHNIKRIIWDIARFQRYETPAGCKASGSPSENAPTIRRRAPSR